VVIAETQLSYLHIQRREALLHVVELYNVIVKAYGGAAMFRDDDEAEARKRMWRW
jgi:hypothetical protein